MAKLQNKIALITGGTTGIGLATAQRFAEEGATVIVTGRNPDTLQAARQQLGDGVQVLKSDASDDADIAALVEKVRADHGRIDVLFLNAGAARFGPVAEAPVEEFDAMWQLNVRGPWLTLQKAVPLLSEGASVIFNTSALDVKGMPGTSAYSSTKAALRSIVRTTANELSANKIRVNAVAPGPVETPIYGKVGLDEKGVDELAQGILTGVPLGRFGAAPEIASAALFLASADSSFVTGAELTVDGGFAQV